MSFLLPLADHLPKKKKPVRISYGLLYRLRFQAFGHPDDIAEPMVSSLISEQLALVEPEQQLVQQRLELRRLERRCRKLEPNRSTKLGQRHSKKQPCHSNHRASVVGWQCVLASCPNGPTGSAKDGSMGQQLHHNRNR
ncbi:MAG: hypothetical protein JNK57_12140 [Planctomycetaceae bacterium]|nr:hypothetical protein [Planctomycetaceae bacterium]